MPVSNAQQMHVPSAASNSSGAASRSSSLPPQVQHEFQTQMGHDFSDVRVHVGHAPTLLGAQSFAHNNNIYFAPGSYNPHSIEGRELIGHELTHVVQQRGGMVPSGEAKKGDGSV